MPSITLKLIQEFQNELKALCTFPASLAAHPEFKTTINQQTEYWQQKVGGHFFVYSQSLVEDFFRQHYKLSCCEPRQPTSVLASARKRILQQVKQLYPFYCDNQRTHAEILAHCLARLKKNKAINSAQETWFKATFPTAQSLTAETTLHPHNNRKITPETLLSDNFSLDKAQVDFLKQHAEWLAKIIKEIPFAWSHKDCIKNIRANISEPENEIRDADYTIAGDIIFFKTHPIKPYVSHLNRLAVILQLEKIIEKLKKSDQSKQSSDVFEQVHHSAIELAKEKLIDLKNKKNTFANYGPEIQTDHFLKVIALSKLNDFIKQYIVQYDRINTANPHSSEEKYTLGYISNLIDRVSDLPMRSDAPKKIAACYQSFFSMFLETETSISLRQAKNRLPKADYQQYKKMYAHLHSHYNQVCETMLALNRTSSNTQETRISRCINFFFFNQRPLSLKQCYEVGRRIFSSLNNHQNRIYGFQILTFILTSAMMLKGLFAALRLPGLLLTSIINSLFFLRQNKAEIPLKTILSVTSFCLLAKLMMSYGIPVSLAYSLPLYFSNAKLHYLEQLLFKATVCDIVLKSYQLGQAVLTCFNLFSPYLFKLCKSRINDGCVYMRTWWHNTLEQTWQKVRTLWAYAVSYSQHLVGLMQPTHVPVPSVPTDTGPTQVASWLDITTVSPTYLNAFSPSTSPEVAQPHNDAPQHSHAIIFPFHP